MAKKKIIPSAKEELPKKEAVVKELRVDDELAKPGKYEITEDEEFKVPIYVKQQDDRWMLVQTKDKADETHEVVFRMWSYEEEVELRKASTEYDDLKRMHFVDHDKLNRFKLQRLLKSWSFEKENPRLKLLHVNGVLVDESYKAMTKLHPNILRYIVDRMNAILEYNG